MAAAGPEFSSRDSERRSGLIFTGWVIFLLAIDLLTLRSFPVPWADEAMFADPAASLMLHGHWTSTLWFSRGDFNFWSGNTPAYSALLVPWLWLWGVSALAVRSLNCVLVALAMLFTWFAVKRLRLIPRPEIRLAALIALSLCYPVSYCVRCGRPDVLGMLIFSIGALCWAGPRRGAACLGLFICAMIIPFVGLQYAFYIPVLLGVLFWAVGKPAFTRIGAIIAGGLVGGILLLAYFQFLAGWDGLLANMADVHARRPQDFWAGIQALLKGQILFYYFGRPHFALLIILAVWLVAIRKHLTQASRRSLVLAVIMLLVPGVIVGFFTHFMAPYHWLAAAPAMILLAGAVGWSWDNFGLPTKALCALLALGLAVSGRVAFISIGAGLGTAGYMAQIETAATSLVPPGGDVLTDPQLYYALKPRAGNIYFRQIVPRLTVSEKNVVSTAFLVSGDAEYGENWLTNSFGAGWTHVTDLPVPCSQVRADSLFAKLLRWFHAGFFVGQPLSVYRRDQVLPESPASMPAR